MNPRTSSPGSETLSIPRRDALAALGLGAVAGAALGPSALAQAETSSPRPHVPPPPTPESMGWDPKGFYVLPPLPYKYEDLEPHIDAETMHLHHDKHHKSYVDGLNKAMAMLAEIRAGKRDAGETKAWVREMAFHGSGHYLHMIFWENMGPKAGGAATGAIAPLIDASFGSFKAFADQFQAATNSVEGSGWGVLALIPVSRQLIILQAEKHQNFTGGGVVPLLVCDVWEHAYYLKYKNVRKDYVAAFMNVINWDAVNRNLEQGMKT